MAESAEKAWRHYWCNRRFAETFGHGENFTPAGNPKVSGEETLVCSHVPSCHLLLDGGSGPGRYMYHLKSRVKRYVCADVSREMLEVARQRHGDLNSNFVRCDLEYLPFRSSVFNVVLCIAVLRHLSFEKGEKVVKSLIDVTKDTLLFSAYTARIWTRVGNPSIVDHGISLETLRRWVSPHSLTKLTELTNEPIQRYLFKVEKDG